MKHILIQRQRVALALLFPGILMAQGATEKGINQSGVQRTKQVSTFLKYAAKFDKHKGDLSNVGMLSGQPVFRTSKGEFFTVEPSTGDLKFHTADSLGFHKFFRPDPKKQEGAAPAARTGMFIKFDGIKGESKVSIAGVDAQGRVVQVNSRGEQFVLGPNGDMQFVK